MTITQINPQSVYQETPGKTTKQNKTKQKTTKKNLYPTKRENYKGHVLQQKGRNEVLMCK